MAVAFCMLGSLAEALLVDVLATGVLEDGSALAAASPDALLEDSGSLPGILLVREGKLLLLGDIDRPSITTSACNAL